MRDTPPYRIIISALCASLLASMCVTKCAHDAAQAERREPARPADTLSSERCLRIVEKLDDRGRVVASYMARRFAFQYGPVRMVWASDTLTEDDVRGPAGLVVFESDDKQAFFLNPPWRLQ